MGTWNTVINCAILKESITLGPRNHETWSNMGYNPPWVPMVDSIKTSWLLKHLGLGYHSLIPISFPPLQLWFGVSNPPPGFLYAKKSTVEKEHRCWVTPPNAAHLPPSWVSRKNVSRPKARYKKKMLVKSGEAFFGSGQKILYIIYLWKHG